MANKNPILLSLSLARRQRTRRNDAVDEEGRATGQVGFQRKCKDCRICRAHKLVYCPLEVQTTKARTTTIVRRFCNDMLILIDDVIRDLGANILKTFDKLSSSRWLLVAYPMLSRESRNCFDWIVQTIDAFGNISRNILGCQSFVAHLYFINEF